jgi:fibro-slime domain-containing protein
VLAVYCQTTAPLVIPGTIHDFANVDSGLPQAYPDFNSFLCGVTTGIVETELGADKLPVFANTQNCVTSADTFYKWFRDFPGVNIRLQTTIVANYNPSTNSYTYTNTQFFPIDGQGYGNENKGHNFGFCLDLHVQFTYVKGQVFDFQGDDDVWVFINNQLAIDLGGTHGPTPKSVDLDTLGLTVGNTYDMDGFFCERHVTGSNLIFSTSVQLEPCGVTDTDGDGNYDQCDYCPSGNLQLNASTAAVSNSLIVPVTVSYSGVYSGSTYELSVNFGDGSSAITQPASPSATVTHVYASAGTYTITATISGGGKGCTDQTAEISVNVTNKKAPVCPNPSGYGLPLPSPAR